MTGRRSSYEIYWEILVYCKSPRSFTAIINRCDLNSKTGQEYLEFLSSKGYLSLTIEGEKTSYVFSPSIVRERYPFELRNSKYSCPVLELRSQRLIMAVNERGDLQYTRISQ